MELRRIRLDPKACCSECGAEPALFALSGVSQLWCRKCGHSQDAECPVCGEGSMAAGYIGRHCLANLVEAALDDFEIRRELELRRVLPQGVTA